MRGKRSHPPNSNETQAHNQIYLPALHALTGCDTVPCMFGIGKATGLNELMGGHDLIELGQQGAYEDKLTSKATSFVAACYGSKVEEDMTSHRYHMRKSKIVDHIH